MRIDEIEQVGQISPEKVTDVKKNNFLFSNLPLPKAKYANVLSIKGGTDKYLSRQEFRKYDEDNDWLTITFVWDPKISAIPSLTKAMKSAIEGAEDYVNQTNQKKFNIALFKLKANKTLLMDGPWPGPLRTVEYIKPDGKTYEQRRVHINKFYINIPAVDLDPSDNPDSMTYFMINNPKKYREWREYVEWNEKTNGENSDYQYILGVWWPVFKRYEYPRLGPQNKKYYDYLEKMILGMRKIGDPTRKAPGEKYSTEELRAFWQPITDYIQKDNNTNQMYHGPDFARYYYKEEYEQAKQAKLFADDSETRLSLQAVVKEEEEEYFGFTIKTTTKGDDKRIEVFSPPKMPETEQTFDTVEDAKKWIDGVIQEVEQQAKDKAEQDRLDKEKQERLEAMRKFPSDPIDGDPVYWKLEDNKLYYTSEGWEGQWQTWSYITTATPKGYLQDDDVVLYDEEKSTGTAFEGSLYSKANYPNLIEYLKKELDLKPKEQEPEPKQKKPEEKDDDQDAVDKKDKTANDVDDIIQDIEPEVVIPSEFSKQKGLIEPPIVGNIKSGSSDNPNRLFFKPQQGSQVAAFSDGEVNMVITTPGKSIIVIDHDNDYRTAYFNITDIKVRKYDTVKRGDVIAMVGKGQVGFEIQRDRRAIDPTGWFKE